MQSDLGCQLLSPHYSISGTSRLRTNSKHNAGTGEDKNFTSVCTNLELSELCLHQLRQMPHGVNTGTLADCQMSQSHTNKPEVGLLNRVKESKGEAYMYLLYQDLCSIHSCFWKNFKFLGIEMLRC